LAKDRKPDDGRARGATRSGAGGNPNRGKGGRTRPPTQVVANAQKRPWGLIAAAVVVVVFAVSVIGVAVYKVRESEADKVTLGDIKGVQSFDYSPGQEHVTTEVDYKESPPVGGPHDGNWADCTGTVYDVDIRHENAVHSLEHGAVWVTYDPDKLSDADIEKLAALVDGKPYRLMSPYAGLDSAISLQSWNHQLKVDSADDERIAQFVDLMTTNADVEGHYPEIGASCENPAFAADPLVEGDTSTPIGPTDMPTGTNAP
jgi:hypothetical protein